MILYATSHQQSYIVRGVLLLDAQVQTIRVLLDFSAQFSQIYSNFRMLQDSEKLDAKFQDFSGQRQLCQHLSSTVC